MNPPPSSPPDDSDPATTATSGAPKPPTRPRRPTWFWLLLFLPAAIAVLPTTIDWAAYRLRGGGDGTYFLASGIKFGLAGLATGLITSVVLAGWEVRHRSPKTPAVAVAIGVFIGVNIVNLGLTIGGCMVGEAAVEPIIRMIR